MHYTPSLSLHQIKANERVVKLSSLMQCALLIKCILFVMWQCSFSIGMSSRCSLNTDRMYFLVQPKNHKANITLICRANFHMKCEMSVDVYRHAFCLSYSFFNSSILNKYNIQYFKEKKCMLSSITADRAVKFYVLILLKNNIILSLPRLYNFLRDSHQV